MAKRGRGQDKKGRSKHQGQYVGVPYVMLESPAWRSLSGAALKVYFELHRRYWGGNNGELSLSLGEAADLLGLAKGTVKRALAELQEKGFIDMTRKGHFYGRRASTFRLTAERCGREPATNDWRHWRPPDQKTEHGSETDPSRSAMGQSRNRRRRHGSASKPVKPRQYNPIGSETDRL